jgi:hypothetical protein
MLRGVVVALVVLSALLVDAVNIRTMFPKVKLRRKEKENERRSDRRTLTDVRCSVVDGTAVSRHQTERQTRSNLVH